MCLCKYTISSLKGQSARAGAELPSGRDGNPGPDLGWSTIVLDVLVKPVRDPVQAVYAVFGFTTT